MEATTKEQSPGEMRPGVVVEEFKNTPENQEKVADWAREQLTGVRTGTVRSFGVGLRGENGETLVTSKEVSGELPK